MLRSKDPQRTEPQGQSGTTAVSVAHGQEVSGPWPESEIAGVRAPYSGRAQTALALAREEAQRYNHAYIGTEHILLGLLREGTGAGAKILSTFGINLDRARHAIEYKVARGDRAVPIGELEFAPRAKHVLELACEESQRLRDADVGTEHLLLGLLAEVEGVGARILDAFDVTLEHARRANKWLIAAGGNPAEIAGPRTQVITCRISDRDLDAIDALVEAGIRTGRSEAASWLISTGIDANPALFAAVYATVTEIRRLRGETQATVQRLTDHKGENRGLPPAADAAAMPLA